MKFEFVDFYPIKNPKKKCVIGTAHIYAIDCQLDIRGILVHVHGKSMFFNLPHYTVTEEETGGWVRYPHIRWTNESTHKEMMAFLQVKVKPLILEKIKKDKE